jgi:hypothetical protein
VPSNLIAVFALLVVLMWGSDALRARFSRRLVQRELERQQLTPILLTRRLEFLRPNWNRYFAVRAVDEHGEERRGLAVATGYFRRRAWFEWDE